MTTTVEQGVHTVESMLGRGKPQAPAPGAEGGRAGAWPTSEAPAPSAEALEDGPIEVDVTEAQEIAEHILADQQLERHEGELADPDSDLQEVQAALRAEHLLAEQIEDERAKERHDAVDEG